MVPLEFYLDFEVKRNDHENVLIDQYLSKCQAVIDKDWQLRGP